MVHNSQLSATDLENNQILPEMVIEGWKVSYLTVISSLMYLMLGTCPDIAYAVGMLSWFSTAPKQMHWEVAKHIFRYIQATKDMELCFDGSKVSMDMDFQGYSNAAIAEPSPGPENSRPWLRSPPRSQSTLDLVSPDNISHGFGASSKKLDIDKKGPPSSTVTIKLPSS
ncbi:hypothetical protein PAXRUDRAFT_22391 [Paxillus rubicundulus Ve08.2h10]|uniref:Retrovirus-related Pol polyprotein from transposon TNT 1-94 n=1 Tax=Paxillus rubicundulus Ve08.2h10 TaxID=930991 RepID=A0A0D0CXK0_9AGAM|nr:hypothetical protein PAXRUDRAFT_22391 [Paxillus rubicundulus Ve08.2h10]